MPMVMFALMMLITLLELEHLFATPGTPEHPQRDGNDQGRRCELEVRLRRLSVQPLAQVHATDRDQPHHRSVG